ncbi:TadE/TadG family type IV pilus assembly protein [Gemmata sp.]|uniref:TadE/TadG family type IV pilus assembly protein n=1 Tax=Gemmata sp. TaxID=1914242 RepID=UPI003F723FCB
MRSRTTPRRRGSTVVESVLVLGVFLTLVVGMLDLGVAVLRQHQVSYAVRGAARAASVRGSEAEALGAWGPVAVGPVPASGAGPVPAEVRRHLCGLDPSGVTIRVDWPDGSNEPGSRVVVTLETAHQPTMTWLFGSGPMVLRAVSTVPISH